MVRRRTRELCGDGFSPSHAYKLARCEVEPGYAEWCAEQKRRYAASRKARARAREADTGPRAT